MNVYEVYERTRSKTKNKIPIAPPNIPRPKGKPPIRIKQEEIIKEKNIFRKVEEDKKKEWCSIS